MNTVFTNLKFEDNRDKWRFEPKARHDSAQTYHFQTSKAGLFTP